MLHTVHFYTRQAAREAKAAKVSLTEAAKVRHETLAERYLSRAIQLGGNKSEPI